VGGSTCDPRGHVNGKTGVTLGLQGRRAGTTGGEGKKKKVGGGTAGIVTMAASCVTDQLGSGALPTDYLFSLF